MRLRPTILAVLALALAVALFFVLKKDDSPEPAPAGPGAGGKRDGGPGAKQPKPPAVPEIRVASGRPQGGVEELEVESGERVEFDVTSDVADEVHVHGYDITEPLPAGKRVEIRFPADLEGAFEIESHGFGTPIAELTVAP